MRFGQWGTEGKLAGHKLACHDMFVQHGDDC